MMIESHLLNEENKNQFIEFLESQRSGDDRNTEWFDMLLWQDNYQKYPCWTFSTNNNNIWCISAVQNHFFPRGVYRVMSRLYIDPNYRNSGGNPKYREGQDATWDPPSMFLFPKQLEFVRTQKEYVCMIMTMEHINRRRPLHVVSKFFNKKYGTAFNVGSKMCQTFENKNDWRAWQVYTCTIPNPPLNFMDDETWLLKFKDKKLSKF